MSRLPESKKIKSFNTIGLIQNYHRLFSDGFSEKKRVDFQVLNSCDLVVYDVLSGKRAMLTQGKSSKIMQTF